MIIEGSVGDWAKAMTNAEDILSQDETEALLKGVTGEAAEDEKLENIGTDALMSVEVNLTVELGRTKIALRNLSSLTVGSVIELNRLAGEPLSIFANDKLIAYGEVVIVNDSFGIKITQIANSGEGKSLL